MRLVSALAVSAFALSLAASTALAQDNGTGPTKVSLKCAVLSSKSAAKAIEKDLKAKAVAACAKCTAIRTKARFTLAKPAAVVTDAAAVFPGAYALSLDQQAKLVLVKPVNIAEQKYGTECELGAKTRISLSYKSEAGSKESQSLEMEVKLKGVLQ